jgi:hypothetical protein
MVRFPCGSPAQRPKVRNCAQNYTSYTPITPYTAAFENKFLVIAGIPWTKERSRGKRAAGCMICNIVRLLSSRSMAIFSNGSRDKWLPVEILISGAS